MLGFVFKKIAPSILTVLLIISPFAHANTEPCDIVFSSENLEFNKKISELVSVRHKSGLDWNPGYIKSLSQGDLESLHKYLQLLGEGNIDDYSNFYNTISILNLRKKLLNDTSPPQNYLKLIKRSTERLGELEKVYAAQIQAHKNSPGVTRPGLEKYYVEKSKIEHAREKAVLETLLNPSHRGERPDLLKYFAEQIKTGKIAEVKESVKTLFGETSTDIFSQISRDIIDQLPAELKAQSLDALFLTNIATQASHAREADIYLNSGGGFHNMMRVNNHSKNLLTAIETYKSFKLPRSELVKEMEIEKFKKILEDIQYDNLGRRKFDEGNPYVQIAESVGQPYLYQVGPSPKKTVKNAYSKYKFSEIKFPPPSNKDFVNYDSTVKIQSEKIPGRHGGELLIMTRRSFKPWLSYVKKSVNQMDPQGSPLFFAYAGGENVAGFFGYKMIKRGKLAQALGFKPKTITAPDIVEINGAIKAINPLLKIQKSAPISVKFYHGGFDVTDRSYLISFGREHLLPMDVEGHLGVHDSSFHTAAALLPPKIIEFSANRAKRVIDFISFVEKKGISPDSKEVKYILRETAAEVDIASGNLAVTAYGRYNLILKSDEIDELFYTAIYSPATANRSSADEALDAMISVFPVEIKAQFQSYLKVFVSKDPDPRYSSRLNLSGLDKPNSDLKSEEIIQAESAALTRLIDDRILEIQEAVETTNKIEAHKK